MAPGDRRDHRVSEGAKLTQSSAGGGAVSQMRLIDQQENELVQHLLNREKTAESVKNILRIALFPASAIDQEPHLAIIFRETWPAAHFSFDEMVRIFTEDDGFYVDVLKKLGQPWGLLVGDTMIAGTRERMDYVVKSMIESVKK